MQIHVIKNTKVWLTISGILFLAAIIGFFSIGLKYGIDFTGGSLMEVQFAPGQHVTAQDMETLLLTVEKNVNDLIAKQVLPSENVNASTTTNKDIFPLPTKKVNLGTPIIVPIAGGLSIKTQPLDQYTHEQIKTTIETKYPGTIEKQFTTIGPTVGDSLKQKAILSLIITWIGMIVFIAWAFRKIPRKVSPWKFGVTAVIALFHDVILPVGVFVLLGQFFNAEVESFFVTALLTIMGFSVHDTIVVFDRIRENMMYQKRDETFAEVAEKSVQQTMVRSINTSLTVFITLLFLFLFGGESTRWFVFTMLIGVVFGTYSSIFIATPLLVLWKQKGVK
jgi:preprotein translocase subunit SecF